MKKFTVSLAGTIIVAALWTIFCIGLALIIPGIFYGIYHGVAPTTELGQIILTIACVYFGAGISIVGGVVSFMLWISGLIKVLE